VLGSGLETGEGLPIERVISHTELLQLMQSPSPEDQPKEITLDDGRVFHGTATSVITDGQRVGRVCILQDVTQFKELDTLKSEFVSTVSHDLRAPLTLMRGYATMLEMVGQLNEQQAIYVGKIVSGVEGMSRLVENLLDLGRIEAGVGLQLEKTSPSEVIDHVIEPFQLQALQKRIKLTPDIPAQEIPLIEADQALLQQAIHNLVENAIKFNRTDGEVILRLEVQVDSVTFSVIDDGIGISPMDQQHLFDKFYRVKIPGSEDRQGTGLGLKIVKSIADRHNGNIRVESRLGQGSTFSLEIPVRQPEREDQK
jgi:signal transduction histidine kinase